MHAKDRWPDGKSVSVFTHSWLYAREDAKRRNKCRCWNCANLYNDGKDTSVGEYTYLAVTATESLWLYKYCEAGLWIHENLSICDFSPDYLRNFVPNDNIGFYVYSSLVAFKF